jgi:hypothetical protein
VLQEMRSLGLIHLGEGSLEILDSKALADAGRFTPDYLLTEPRTTWQQSFTLPVPPPIDMPISAVPALRKRH